MVNRMKEQTSKKRKEKKTVQLLLQVEYVCIVISVEIIGATHIVMSAYKVSHSFRFLDADFLPQMFFCFNKQHIPGVGQN